MSTQSQEVQNIRENAISRNSRIIYLNSTVRFILFLHEKAPTVLSEDLRSLLEGQTDDNNISKTIKSVLTEKSCIPFNFELISDEVFINFIISMKNSNGTLLTASAYNGHRAALFNVFRDYEKVMSSQMSANLKTFFRGLKNTIAQQTQAGDAPIKVGKDPLQFADYKFLALSMIRSRGKEHIFAHTFFLFCWNLMCRAGNTESICIEHLAWSEDSLCVFFAHSKTDQGGEKPRDPRHLYANPLCPEICPILSLGVYLLSFPDTVNDVALFPGCKQYERFRQIFSRLCSEKNILCELERRGVDPSCLGTHSMRKGSATFCSSGSTACPPPAAISLRAGWSIGTVADKYIHYQMAGDMYVGRTVVGLPIDSETFGILPPFFIANNETEIAFLNYALDEVFPGAPISIRRVAEFCLASVVHHRQYLRDNMHKHSILFESCLFKNPILLNGLSELVQCRLGKASDKFKTTGVPPHSSLLLKLHETMSAVQQCIPAIEAVVPKVVGAVVKELEDRAIGAGTVTREGLENVLMDVLRAAGVLQMVSRTTTAEVSRPLEEIDQNISVTYLWDGKLHRLPEDFSFPKGGMSNAWNAWCCGDKSKNYPPLRFVEPDDLCSTAMRKRLCDFRFLMNSFEDILRENSNWVRWRPKITTLEEANSLFQVIQANFTLQNNDSKKCLRMHQLHWNTIVNKLRKKIRE